MTLQISCNPATLTTEQREAVAAFIKAFPVGVVAATMKLDITADSGKLKEAVADAMRSDELSQEIGHLAREGGEFEAGVAFGNNSATDPAAAFGAAPLAQGVPPAPSTAAAAPSATAPAAPLGTTSAETPTAPVPPAAPSANAATPAALPTASHAPGVDVDKHGLPWDARIHAESKAKIADGSWRKKRGVDPALVTTVEAELKALMSAPAAQYANSDWPFPGFPLNANGTPAATPEQPAGNVSIPPAPPSPPVSSPTPAAAGADLPVATSAAPSAPAAPGAFPLSAPGPVSAPPAPTSLPAPPAAPAGASPINAASAAASPQDNRAQFVALVGRASAAIQGGKVTQAEVTECCAKAGVPALPLLANRLDLVPTVAASFDALVASKG